MFGVALQETDDFANDSVPFDGLMGLAQSVSLTTKPFCLNLTMSLQTLSNQKVPTPVEALASSKLIAGAITSFKISRLSDGKNDGEVTFGGLDATKFDAKSLVSFANVNKQGFWEGAATFAVGGTDLGLSNRTAILDTGNIPSSSHFATNTHIYPKVPL